MKIFKEEKYLFVAIFVYICLAAPFLTSIPYLDGNIDFVKSYDYYNGGFTELFNNWRSVHPPLKLILISIFYKLFGVNVYVFNSLGLLLEILGITSMYLFTRKALGKTTANLTTVLISTSPLFISVGFFSLIDFLLTVFILSSFYFYVTQKYVLFAFFASLAVLSKETGLVFISSILSIEALFWIIKIAKKDELNLNLQKIISLLIPFIVIFCGFLS